jgi:hypothetical protein
MTSQDATAVVNPCPQVAENSRLMAYLAPGQPCPGCQARPGQAHQADCLCADCLHTGLRRQACAADQQQRGIAPEDRHDCGTDTWPGYDRTARDAINLGWATLGDHRSIKVAIDHPDAVPDIDRLVRQAAWNPDTHTWAPRY